MIRFALILGMLLATSVAMAEYSIKASGYTMNLDMRQFEVCGAVSGGPMHGVHVIINVDPGKNQGFYVSPVDSSGHFCQIIRAQTGRVNLYAEGHDGQKLVTSFVELK